MNLNDQDLLRKDDHFKRIVNMAIINHIVNLRMDQTKAGTEDLAMANRIFYRTSGYSVEEVAEIAGNLIAGGAHMVFANKPRQQILEELLTGGEAETQLKAAIATYWTIWEKPN